MISLSASGAIVLYLMFTLGTLFAFWIYHHFHSKNRVILSPQEELFLCEYCHSLYTEKSLKVVNRCPICQCLNKSNQFRP